MSQIIVHPNSTIIVGSSQMPVDPVYPSFPPLSGEVNKNIVVRCFPQWYKTITLEWDIPISWGNCVFNVYFSPVETGNFQKLNPAPLTSPHYSDNTTKEYSKIRHGYYVVEVLLVDHNMTFKSIPSTWATKSRSFIEIRSAEIQRREYLLLTKFVGVKSFLFKRKPYGVRCPRCWSEEQEKVMDDHCPVCLGTSYEGGFFDPSVTFLQYDPSPNELVDTYFGQLEPNQIGCWTISLPVIGAGDVLIRSGDWNVYEVARVQNTELQTNTVRQMVTITQLSKFDIENTLVSRTPAPSKYLEMIGGEFSEERLPARQIDEVPQNDYIWSPNLKDQTLPIKYNIP